MCLSYYVTEQCGEQSTSNIKEENLCPWEVQILRNDLIGQLWQKQGFEHLHTPGVCLLSFTYSLCDIPCVKIYGQKYWLFLEENDFVLY